MLVLASLASGPKHGHAMADDILRLCGTRLGPGTLYGAIARLEQQGWIAPLAAGGAPPALPHHGRRRARLAREADYAAKVQQGRTPPVGGVVNVRLARLLTRLYPRAWRQRYGKEFQAFLEAERAGLRASWTLYGRPCVST